MKQYTVIFTPRAQRQLAELYANIADKGGEERAEKFVGGIVNECLSLSTFPERGNKRDDIRPNLRAIGYRRRVSVAFSVDPATEVVAIHGAFYGGQDFERILYETGDD